MVIVVKKPKSSIKRKYHKILRIHYKIKSMRLQGYSLKESRETAIKLYDQKLLGPRGGVLKKPRPRARNKSIDFVARGWII